MQSVIMCSSFYSMDQSAVHTLRSASRSSAEKSKNLLGPVLAVLNSTNSSGVSPSASFALLIFGSGPGIGRNVAMLFAERGFRKVVLMSRNKERLAQDADLVRSASADVDVHEITVDAC